MKNSNKKIILAVVLCSTILSSCSLFSKPEKKSEQINESTKKVEQTTDSNKQSTIKKDKTTEVLIDSEIKKEDIAKIVKHGDHWHVFTKDGREKITYKDPNKLQNTSNFEMVSVVGKSRLKGENVVAIKKHGDHWHVYLRNGGEYLTYEDPSAMFPHIKVGTYVGSHGDHRKHNNKRMDARTIAHEKQKIKQTIEKNDERVIKILKHGDHYHIYTSKGNEFVSYTDPRSLYPNAEYGQYVGTHANRKQMIEKIIREDRQKQKQSSKKTLAKQNSDKLIKDDKLVKVEDNKKKHNVVKILKHGDHWHIYTKNGEEFITYEDPSSKYPDVAVGTYVGSHTQENAQRPQQPRKDNKDNKDNKPQENLPENPTDTPQNNKPDKKEEKPTEKTREQKIQELKITKVLGKDGTVNEINRFDIVKILKHEDHYHIYDSNGNEAITYTNPQDLYPNAYFGNYEGSHNNSQNNNSQNNNEFKWPENITKIVDHKDHWHLYRGDEEVAVVRVNPKDHYPNAEYIKDYIDVGNVEVEDADVFNYDDIKAKKVEGIEAVLNDNLRNMTGYGKLTDGIAIMGTEDKQDNVFYWLHGDHYHALSIKDLVKMEKSGALKGFTAKDVVATLKYKFQHPQEDLTYKSDLNIEEIIEFLKSHYKINNASRIFSIGQETVDIYTNDTTNSFHISQFEKKNGQIIFKGQLPQIPSDDELEKQEEATVEETEEEIGEKETAESTNKKPVEDKKPEEKQEEKPEEKQPENKENKEDKKENKKQIPEEKQNLPTEKTQNTTETNSANI